MAGTDAILLSFACATSGEQAHPPICKVGGPAGDVNKELVVGACILSSDLGVLSGSCRGRQRSNHTSYNGGKPL